MEHEKFVQLYNSGQSKVHVNQYKAKQLLQTDIMPKRYVCADIFWSWIWLLSFPIGIVLIIWVNKWVGIAVIVVGLILPKAQRRSASQFVLEYALQNKEFYELALEHQVISTEMANSALEADITKRKLEELDRKQDSKIHFTCPNCQTKYSALPEQVGQEGKCKNCGETIVVQVKYFFSCKIEND